jgi:hypothetical protein
MKKIIIFGSIFAVCILMILPSVSAIEFTTVAASNKVQIFNELHSRDLKELRDTIKSFQITALKEKTDFSPLLILLLDILFGIGNLLLAVFSIGPFGYGEQVFALFFGPIFCIIGLLLLGIFGVELQMDHKPC